MSNRWDLMRVSLTRRFFFASILQATIVLVAAYLMALIFGRQAASAKLRLPAAFAFSTVFLAVGSYYLERARLLVRLERQPEFRQALVSALGFAMLFVSVQGYGICASFGSCVPLSIAQIPYPCTETNNIANPSAETSA